MSLWRTLILLSLICGLCLTSLSAQELESITPKDSVDVQVESAIGVESEILLPSHSDLVMPLDILNYGMTETDAYWLAVEVNAAALEYGVPVRLLWEVIRIESGFHHLGSNGKIKRSKCNAQGICQIIKDGMAIKKRHNIEKRADNIRCGAEILAFALHDRKYSLLVALGWYNSGDSIIVEDYSYPVANAYKAWAKKDGEIPIS